jgi:hypothetical protein
MSAPASSPRPALRGRYARRPRGKERPGQEVLQVRSRCWNPREDSRPGEFPRGLAQKGPLTHGPSRSILASQRVDLKEAVKAAAPHAGHAKMPSDQAERGVEGARHLSPYLGDRMLAAKLTGNSVFVRELMPADNKLVGEDGGQLHTRSASGCCRRRARDLQTLEEGPRAAAPGCGAQSLLHCWDLLAARSSRRLSPTMACASVAGRRWALSD